MEERCLDSCIKRRISFLSVAHRPSVIPYHSAVLKLTPGAMETTDTHAFCGGGQRVRAPATYTVESVPQKLRKNQF